MEYVWEIILEGREESDRETHFFKNVLKQLLFLEIVSVMKIQNKQKV